MFDRELQELNSTWAYKYDIDQYASKEHWKIMKKHPYVGDCEDYALTLLYLISGKSMLKFWMYLITGKAQIRRVITKNGGGHAVLRCGGGLPTVCPALWRCARHPGPTRRGGVRGKQHCRRRAGAKSCGDGQ